MSRDCTSVIRKGVEYYDEEVREDGGWELFRHLSSLRRSALCWYPFAPDSRVLEVGCGYGALTGILCEKAAFVEAVEKDPLRAEMTRKRYAGRNGLRVTAADIDAFRPEDRFDYIVAVEFLETYENDAGELLARLRSWLRPGGKLLLGFRNRRALKYLCGASDEFVRQPGNECVPGARLYTRREMRGLLMKAGFADPRWFYPLPDFGYTQAVYTDDWLPGTDVRDRIITYDPFGEDTVCARLESEAYREVIASGSFADTANVFLAECAGPPADAPGAAERLIGAVMSSDRERTNAFLTAVYDSGTVVKQPLFPEGGAGLAGLCRNAEELEAAGIRVVPHRPAGGGRAEIRMPYMTEELLIDHIRKLLHESPEEVGAVFTHLYDDICCSSETADSCLPELDAGMSPVLKKAYIDMIPNNAFRVGGDIVYFDQEFSVRNCPAAYVLFRALRYTWLHIAEAEEIIPLETMKERFGLKTAWDMFQRYEDGFTFRNRNMRLYEPLYRWAWQRKPSGAEPDSEAERFHDLRGIWVETKISNALKAKALSLDGLDGETDITVRLLYCGAAERSAGPLHPPRDPHTYSRLEPPFPEEPQKPATWGVYRDGKQDLWATYNSWMVLKDPGLYRSGLKIVFEVPELLAEKEPELKISCNGEVLHTEVLREAGIVARTLDIRGVSSGMISYIRDMRRLQRIIVEEIARICRKYGITWYLFCGGLIGTMRDGDLIPWDDDLDIALLRGDHEKLAEAVRQEWAEDGDFLWLPCDGYGGPFLDFMTRVVYRGERAGSDAFSRLRGHGREDIHDRAAVDIYVLDTASDDRRRHAFQSRKLRLLYALALGHRPSFETEAHTEYKRGTRIAVELLRRVGGAIPLKMLLRAYQRSTKRYRRSGGQFCYMANGYYLCFDYRFRKEWFGAGLPARVGEHLMPVPVEAEKVLGTMYGNYRQYPPVWLRHPAFMEEERKDEAE